MKGGGPHARNSNRQPRTARGRVFRIFQMLCGENEKIETVLLEETDSPESFYEKLDMAVSRANGEHGLIILADIPGEPL